MSIEIKAVRDKGFLNKERVVLRVVAPSDIGDYLVGKSFYISPDGFSSGDTPTYLFPDKKVKAGDLIVLYTKRGQPKEKLNSNGSTTYFYYWGQTLPLWLEKKAAVLLVHAVEYEFRQVYEEDEDAEEE